MEHGKTIHAEGHADLPWICVLLQYQKLRRSSCRSSLANLQALGAISGLHLGAVATCELTEFWGLFWQS